MSGSRALVVEDEPSIAEVLEYNLDKGGFTVETEPRGDVALDAIRSRPPDLILLNLMLPGLDGLELGADDYITKPFSPRQVVLRLKAVLRRTEGQDSRKDDMLEVGRLSLDAPGHRLLVSGNEVKLTATEFRLLRFLMERCNRAQIRETLLTDVWEYSEDVGSRSVDTHIRRLRRKLRAEATRIETVIGVGYRMRS